MSLPSDLQSEPSEAVARLRRLQFDDRPGEAPELAALTRLLAGCDRFIDVGANIGLYLFHANRALHGAEIVAVEANARLLPVLEETCRRARADADNRNDFRLECCAVLDEPGTVEFFVTPNLDDSSIFSARIPEAVRISVPTRRLDDFYEPSRKTVIKMDIEGAEYRALKSAGRFLGCGHVEFFLELHPWGDPKISKYPLHVCNLFYRNGFACRRVHYHYHFAKAGVVRRTLAYLSVFPHLFLMWLENRHPGPIAGAIARLHRALSKVRRRLRP